MLEKPPPILIGFFPKKTERMLEWLKASGVEEVCSVSKHISAGPRDWLTRGRHSGPWRMFRTETDAMKICGRDIAGFDIYAYRLFPFVFSEATIEPVTVEAIDASLDSYKFLGYDMVNSLFGCGFECSPLSCNKAWTKYEVNKYCLMDDLDAAWQATVEIAKDGNEKGTWEPGLYYLLEVWRKQK